MTWPVDGEPAWVFAYGSLMWNPCFPHLEARRALLHGYHRSLCILSVINRGTPASPGLALGLDRGGACSGYAFRIAPTEVAEAKARLWEREMVNAVYQPRTLLVRLDSGERVRALVFVARPEHPQYARLLPEEAAVLVAQGVGTYGTAIDYLRNVVRHLDELGIGDGPLHRILQLAAALLTATGETDQEKPI